ncbi:MAG TPA: type IV secretion system DNA-binding domain-containing protein [Thermoplasmata archaeon]|nr:type IV secretion system DNA-binding domain-containing protein [Thermoplasmata archaeon]
MSLWGSPDGPEAAYRFRPRGPSWDHPFLRRFSEALAAHPRGSAALLERIGDDDPFLVPGSPAVARAIFRAAGGLPGTLETLRPVPAVPAFFRGSVVFGLVAPAKGPEIASSDPEGAGRPAVPSAFRERPSEITGLLPEEPRARPPDGPVRVAFQHHWWSTGGSELAVRLRFAAPAASPGRPGLPEEMAASLASAARSDLAPFELRVLPASARRRRAWARGTLSGLVEGRPFLLRPEIAGRLARPNRPDPAIGEPVLARHVVVLGASGSGKTSFLVQLARERIEAGRAIVVFDLHGDLGPSIVAGLSEAGRARVVAVDAARSETEIPGVPLFAGTTPSERERESAHLVASFRHLSAEGAEVYWGHRLEQVFDVFVRLVEEEGGGFADLYELLTDPSRQDAARYTTRRHAAARFLEELPSLLRRNPEYLQSAIARVQKVALQPKLGRLFAPAAHPVPVARWLGEGGSIIWRVPSSEVGPLGSRFATTLLASRVYLGLASRRMGGPGLRVLLVLDEAQALAPSLLAEVLSEGRKFGVGAVVATQYAGRLAPDALGAAIGAAGTHVAFRVPRSGAAASGQWVGLHPTEAERLLPALPTGVALIDAPPPFAARRLVTVPPMPDGAEPAWTTTVLGTNARLGADRLDEPVGDGGPGADERLLLAIVGLEERGVSPSREEIARSMLGGEGALPPSDLEVRLPMLVRRGWLEESDRSFRLSMAGARRLGIGAPSGATRESEEHRALLIAAFRIFARHGERMEFVRQGRFDTRLPDGRVALFPSDLGRRAPGTIAREVDERRRSWAYRAFGGRDVHVEAEVSGAERPERVRRGLEKARDRRASVVFLVGDAHRARRVRATLASAGASPPEAQVWTLGAASRPRRKPDEPPAPSPGPGSAP